MQAVLCKAYGLPETLAVAEVPSPTAGPKQVIVSVRACGVNFPDTLIIQLKPHISAVYPLSAAADALTLLMTSQATGKVVLEVGQ